MDELFKEKAFSETVINSLPGVFYLFDEEGRFLRWNRNFRTITGYSDEELSTMSPIDFFKDAEKQKVAAAIQEVFLRGDSSVEAYFLSKDKTQTPYFFTGTLFISDGKKYLTGMGMDISELKRTEKALRDSEEKFGLIIETANEGIRIMDDNLVVTYANQKMCDMLGYTIEEIIGRKWTDFLLPDEIADFNEKIELRHQGISGQYERRLKKKDGGVLWTHASATPIMNKDGRFAGTFTMHTDITERKQIEEEKEKMQAQLLQSQKMEAIGTLAGGVAHDFNNILTAMAGYSQILPLKMKEGDPLRRYVDGILASVDRASNLTKGLLAFSRKQIMQPRPTELNGLVKKAREFLGRIIGEDIDLQISFAQEDLTVMADPGQIEQVIMNLAVNARDAMPEGGQLSLQTGLIVLDEEFIKDHGYGRPGKYVALSVTDTGIGMDDSIREKIFEPFFTTKEVGKGTGLGLSMTYGIIKQHDGYINVYSAPKKGTVFTIYLPLMQSFAVEPLDSLEISTKGGTETVLLAEDDQALSNLIKSFLTDAGYKVMVADDGKDALSKFKDNAEDIDLLLTDVIMPGMSGKALYDEIRKIKPRIKVLFISGYPKEIISKTGVLEKGLPLIEKPLTPHELLKKIRDVLDGVAMT